MPALRYLIFVAAALLVCFAACNQTEILPNPVHPFKVQSNLLYNVALNYRGEEVELYLDAYQPQNGKKNPCIVLLHGGDLMQGNKDEWKGLAETLAQKDITAIAINYRLGRGGNGEPCNGDAYTVGQSFYRAVQDVHAAFRYLVQNAETLGIDTSQLFAGGTGVGGVAALSLGHTTQTDYERIYPGITDDLGEVNASGNLPLLPFRLRGIVHWRGAWLTESPGTGADVLPVMGFLNATDSLVPEFKGPFNKCSNYPMLYGSRFIQDKMQAYNTTAILHRRVGGDTGLDDNYYYSSNINCFIKDVKAGKLTKGILTNNIAVCP
ncbi:Carboxylesterase family protein [Cnuella takakiae]|uniref:Carboxylesterase family protein n=1 Tax=Cnuella takakiae TaxID=1302690 RepID=A0A1M5BCV8_9BACT|nr:alpha/beta hydrolase [Cnuella takakiae]OLY93434.1 hypothetical protein BUE76_17245 [Cnuella takakiae]SHF40329.1 Carboxylesterase family protein [Cnuella takakiae]